MITMAVSGGSVCLMMGDANSHQYGCLSTGSGSSWLPDRCGLCVMFRNECLCCVVKGILVTGKKEFMLTRFRLNVSLIFCVLFGYRKEDLMFSLFCVFCLDIGKRT